MGRKYKDIYRKSEIEGICNRSILKETLKVFIQADRKLFK